ncbi:MAG TPA: serine hydrolase [Nitrospirota bacterium]|nr:serine hydrolase [Nitrospirota bacterium]
MESDKEKIVSIKRPLLLTLIAASFALGVFVGAGMGLFSPPTVSRSEVVPDQTEDTFRFIRASVESSNAGKLHAAKELKPFKYKVNALIEDTLKRGDAVAVSVYFRDLNNGNRFAIKGRDKFSPKSLLKVPLMIAYFKWAESNPLVLRKTLTMTGTGQEPVQRQSDHEEKLEPGKAYTVNDLIFRMIAHDDTDAYALLYANLPASRLEKIFSDLYVEYDPNKQEDSISLNAFSGFFRVLYNASYLTEDMSEKALRYLSKSSFRSGMVAGIPPNVDISSKHGERRVSAVTTEGDGKELSQLHEFGIIYHPNRPFILGVMVRGEDFDRLTKTVRDITRLVYEEVDKQS